MITFLQIKTSISLYVFTNKKIIVYNKVELVCT